MVHGCECMSRVHDIPASERTAGVEIRILDRVFYGCVIALDFDRLGDQ